ncbi:IclR family transcriptional regulator [Sphingobium xenophagum]|uniref:IclR family transcriptional regulator n=1 Tax=Sphingobium xenophagum TaxID=121428 RepID=UPI0002E72933|nr:IclR family transcriptional regulator C-terminal domain-containing protein [Sphingobium xenophagum]
MSASDNALAALFLFTSDQPEWTVELAAEALSVSGSTAYRYFNSLNRFELITAIGNGRYVLGPAIIALDRQIRTRDPLVQAAGPVMRELIRRHQGEGIALLCRAFRGKVMCVEQSFEHKPDFAVSYERGRPMGLFRGAASLAILAHQPVRTHRRLWDQLAPDITAAGLGSSWEEFLQSLRKLRAQNVLVTHAQLDPGVVGIAAPILRDQRQIVGCVCLVIAEKSASASEIAWLSPLVQAAATEIETAMAESAMR